MQQVLIRAPHILEAGLFLITSTFLLGLIFIPLISNLARKLGLIDVPGQRKIHKVPTPLAGGLVLMLVGLLVLLANQVVFLLINPSTETMARFGSLAMQLDMFFEAIFHSKQTGYILAAVGVVWLVGLLDDLAKKKNWALYKFLGQILAALLVVKGGNITISISQYTFFNDLISIVWLVGITNCFNLLDNMDGLSAGVASICLGVFFCIALWMGQYVVALGCALFIGSLLAFLIFNFHPAKIFLGDNGSLIVGLWVGISAILVSYQSYASGYFFSFAIPLVVLALPLSDIASVILIRIKNKKPIYVGDTNHLSHRLVKCGFSVRQSVLILYLVTIGTSFCGILMLKADLWFSIVILIVVFVQLLLFNIILLFAGKPTREQVP